ncbi:hypothetical protein [Methylocystis echinoides]|uniref:Uncharacterized protein n=1 Tax=Methylocystis echinoides TaxID=29468 RepID=A0A9W6GR88_9HYPH|nr:hypothetical protein [Methylocystis echinoides]GLI91395.1 hypothetical protein LMG27198_03870 [Methylocystis echinoides]
MSASRAFRGGVSARPSWNSLTLRQLSPIEIPSPTGGWNMENFPWLLPAWLIGAPFVLGLIDYFMLPRAYR